MVQIRVKPRRTRCTNCRVLQPLELLIRGLCTSCLIQDPLPLFEEVKDK